MAQTYSVITRSNFRIIAALIILAVISSASVITMSVLLVRQEYDASLINQAGRQRMLSQRIAFGVHQFIQELERDGKAQEGTLSLIRESTHLMISSHKKLTSIAHSNSIKPLYFEGEPPLNAIVLDFTRNALEIINATHAEQLKNKDLHNFDIEDVSYLLFRLNNLVTAYEEEANTHLSQSFKTELAIWLISIIVLILEYIYIFKPMLNIIRTHIRDASIKQNRMQLAADSVSLGIWEFNLNDQSLKWDNKMWEMFNESIPQDHINTFELFEKRLHQDDRQYVLDTFNKAIENESNMSFSFRIITPSNNVRHIQVNSIIEYNHNNQAIKVVGTNQDITEQKHKEDALIEAKEKAESATRIKGEFLASMSHEIRTPLNGVMGMLSLLKNTPLNHLQTHRINIAISSSQSLLALINDILDFSKIETNKLVLEEIDFDLNKLLAELVDNLAQLAINKNIELILDSHKIVTTRVKGDPGRIRQLLTNLLANAIKFTHDGHVILSASLTEYSQDNWQLDFSIEDTGIGIPEEKQPHLFDAFSQVDGSTTREYGGTGLGLAIVKRLTTSMGGAINLRSSPNQGSRFYGHIILGKSHTGEVVAPNFDVSQLDVLIVDDNSVNLSILADHLAHWGVRVHQAISGHQALVLCEQRVMSGKAMFDIAILDMQMPNMDGAELGKRFKQDPRFSSMKLVMMTSMQIENDNQYMAGIGFSAQFTKPVNTSDLFLALSVIGDNGEAFNQAKTLLTHDYLNSLKSPVKVNETDIKHYLTQLKNVDVLLIEDNPINQLVATDLLEEMGFKVYVAEDGLDGLSQLNARKETPFCLILMDCQMPRMDGFEATKHIRKGKGGAIHTHTPIIAVTANATKSDQQKCVEAGMNDFIPKPIEHHLLEHVLLSWLLPSN